MRNIFQDRLKQFIANHNIKFYTIDGVKIGIETGMGPTRINTILQSAFFKLTGIIPVRIRLIELMKAAAKATYGRKGDDVVHEELGSYRCWCKAGCRDQKFRKAGKTAADEGLAL